MFGSGFGIISKAPQVKCHVFFVRGPLTCSNLGLSSNLAITDGAYLLRDQIFSFAKHEKKHFKYGVIPHHNALSKKIFNKLEHNNDHVQLIDPVLSTEEFIKKVAQCEKVICESLHGAIIADILSVPFCIRQTTQQFDSFKFLDWTSSMGIDLGLEGIVNHDFEANNFDKATYINSSQNIKEQKYKLLLEKEQELKQVLKVLNEKKVK